MTTMGQAIDQSIKRHEETYPGSEVYQAEAKDVNLAGVRMYRVEYRASHFSVPMTYYVPIA